MTDAPERIWAWVWNLPRLPKNGDRCWTPFPPVWPKPFTTRKYKAWWDLVGERVECHQEPHEYVRADLVQQARNDALEAAAAIAESNVHSGTGKSAAIHIRALIKEDTPDD